MNRKAGKLASRIPTFHKRPASGSQSTETPVLRKDNPVPVAQPPQKAESGSAEASKSKLPDAREPALPLPVVVVPKVSLDSYSLFSSIEQPVTPPHSSQITAPKSWSFSGSEQLMTPSPRPALRPEQDSEQHLPEEDTVSQIEALATVATEGQLPPVDPLSERSQKDAAETHDVDADSRFRLRAYGNADTSEAENIFGCVDAIMDEEPPWLVDPMNVLESKDSRSSSDAECEENVSGEKHKDEDSVPAEEHHHLHTSRMETLNSNWEEVKRDEKLSDAVTEPTRVQATKSTEVSCFILRAIYCM